MAIGDHMCLKRDFEIRVGCSERSKECSGGKTDGGAMLAYVFQWVHRWTMEWPMLRHDRHTGPANEGMQLELTLTFLPPETEVCNESFRWISCGEGGEVEDMVGIGQGMSLRLRCVAVRYTAASSLRM